MNMIISKYTIYVWILVFTASISFSSCDDLLDVNSSRQVTDDEFGSNPNDSLYGTFGILSQLQKLGDSYVLLGELRADLMDVTDISDISLKEINGFNISGNNPYVNINDYYAVINNCNYMLHKLDTSKIDKGQYLNLRHFAAIKSIRAWTYMQLVLNFKTAKFYTHPILSIEDSKKEYPEYTFEELADLLIADLEPLKDIPFPNLGYIGSYNTTFSYFPIRFLLGDLYLWKGEYASAAREYYNLIYKNRVVIGKNSTSSWQTINNTIGSTANLNWINSYIAGSGEVISSITCPTQYGQVFNLDSLTRQQKIVPSILSLKNWENQTYFLNEASSIQGDLRKFGSVWWKENVDANTLKNSVYQKDDKEYSPYFIYKFLRYNQNITVYRNSLLYLRYAEAMNRLNKPNFAFAILKYGLSSANYNNKNIIPVAEKDSIHLDLMNFSDSRFNENVGIRMRACGNADKDTTFYRLNALNTLSDSVLFVENLIQEELALETAFEGNRFHDLMRFSLRRIKNGEGDESYLADKVALKHKTNASAIRSKLMNSDNWYIRK